MPALQIRDLPEPIHKMLVERARQDRRTIAQEATVLLEQALAAPPQSERERRRELLARIDARQLPKIDFSKAPTPEEIIREDRNR